MITLIFGVILLIVGMALIPSEDFSCRNYVAFLLIAIGVVCLNNYKKETTPQAIDVYRGKTTLEITYKDTIPIDSVVVFK